MKNNNGKTLLLTSLVCLIPTIAGLLLYSQLPELMPTQIAGPDGTAEAPKWFAVIGMPVFVMLFNLFLHRKANRGDDGMEYPVSMIVFLKWAMPFVSLTFNSMPIAVALGFSSTVIMLLEAVSAAVLIVGWYAMEYAEKKFCGIFFIIGGFLAALGFMYGIGIKTVIVLAVAVVIGIFGSKRK